MSTPKSNDIHCKVQYGNDFRRFVYDNSEFASFLQQIKDLFGFNSDVVLKYKDDEGDMVTISSDDELEFAIDVFAGSILRLTVYNREVAPEFHPMGPHHEHFGRWGPGCGRGPWGQTPHHGLHHELPGGSHPPFWGPHHGHHEHFGGRWGPGCGRGQGRGGHCGKEGRGAMWRERWINKMQANPELLSNKIDMLTKKRDHLKTRLDWIQNKDTSCPRKEHRNNHITWKLQKVESRLAHLQAIVIGSQTNAPVEPIVTNNQVPIQSTETSKQSPQTTLTKAALVETLNQARDKRAVMHKAMMDEHKEMQSIKSEIQSIRGQGRNPDCKERIVSLKETLGNYRTTHLQKKAELQAQDALIRDLRAQIQSLKKEKM